MSRDIEKTRNYNNEEIINDLTKDLENQLIKDSENDEENAVNNNVVPNNFECSDEDETSEEKKELENDFVDEDELKEFEKSLSEEDIETRKKQALELKKQGNEEYTNKEYIKSVNTYTEALKLCPLKCIHERAIFYANRAACKINLGKQKSALDDCSKAIELNDKYVRAYLRRAKLFEETDKLDESLEDYKKILELDPGNVEALKALQRLPPKIQERNEKLKDEMMGKLKDLGNLILKPFGLSTNNFALQQDPNTGGYSVQFNQNPKV